MKVDFIHKRLIAATLVAISFPAISYGASFQLVEQNATTQGNAVAGAAAVAEDVSTIFFNPAGLTRLSGHQLAAAGHVIDPSSKFKGTGSFNPRLLPAPLGGAPFAGSNGGDAGDTAFVPNFYYMYDYSPTIKLGIGVNVPFGLKTEYDRDWVGRYHAVLSELKTVNISPTAAFKVSDVVSVGVGVNVLYADVDLTNAVDFGLLDATGALGRPAGSFGLIPSVDDGFAKIDGDDTAVGYNFGVLFEPTDRTRVGFAYRSEQDIEFDGGDLDVQGPARAPFLAFKTGVNADVTLPDIASLSLYHEINSQWAFLADVSRTDWGDIQEIAIERADGRPATILTLNYDDSMRYSVGAIYKPGNNWTFRGGLALDETPTPNDESRSARIPDDDRFWLSLGGSYEWSQQASVDFAYSHLFIDDYDINATDAFAAPLTQGLHLLQGEYEASVDILSVQFNWRF